MVIFDEKEVNAVKEYLKQIHDEVAALADRVKLDGQIRWGLEDKFNKVSAILEKPEPIVERVAKVDVRTGIKKVL